jgi:hypothetical protein
MLTFFYAFITLGLIAVVAFNEYYQRSMKVCPMPTAASTRKVMIEGIHQPSPKVIAELGSGWGGVAIAAATRYPDAQVIGFEGSLMPLLFSKLRKALHPRLKNLRFVKKNFFENDMRDVDVVLCYLSNPHMAQLEPKLHKELKNGAEIVSSTFYMPHWLPREKSIVGGIYDTPVYIYEKTGDTLPDDMAPAARAAQ